MALEKWWITNKTKKYLTIGDIPKFYILTIHFEVAV